MTYLEAAGIEMYVPRFLLHAAPAPVKCELPILSEPSQSGSIQAIQPIADQADLSPSSARSSSQIAALFDSKSPDPKNASAEVTEETKEIPMVSELTETQQIAPDLHELSAEAESIQFTLALWNTDSGLQIIDSVDPQDAIPTQLLLSNILIAHHLMKIQLPGHELLSWPVDQKNKNASWDEARAFMTDFLEGRFLSKPPKAILAFGDTAVTALLGKESLDNDVLFQQLRHAEINLPVLVLPSLKQLLYAPDQKGKLWQALSSLKKML